MNTKIQGKKAETFSADKLQALKKLATVAMFADDDLLEQLVLKGGNAMDLVLGVSSRASVDLDFSMKDDFDQAWAQERVERSLVRTFELDGYLAFDVKMVPRPGKMPEDLASFWGGYQVEFKVISIARANEVARNPEVMRREAIRLGQGTRFTIDISRYEYIDDKQVAELDGYRIYVYTPEMIVCEKLRAICQQMPEYAEIIMRSDKGHQRARDFVDIETLVRTCKVDVNTERARHIVQEMFRLKRVPLSFLPKIGGTKDFHGGGFDEVRATVRAGVKLEPWQYYFDFVNAQVAKLEPLWHV
jgi:predicted nucleotidyltransferase component of viral defense system